MKFLYAEGHNGGHGEVVVQIGDTQWTLILAIKLRVRMKHNKQFFMYGWQYTNGVHITVCFVDLHCES